MDACLIERTVLGMCMEEPGNLEKALARGITPSSFFDGLHQKIFSEMCFRQQRGDGYGCIELACTFPLEAPELVKIRETGATTQNAETYIDELVTMQRADLICDEIRALERAVTDRRMFEPVSVLDEAIERAFQRISPTKTAKSGPKRISDALDQLMPEIEQRILDRREGKPSGIPTGFTVLDMATGGGFAPGTINVVAARTGRGKTTLAVNFLTTAALAGYGAAYFTVEMPTPDILQKVLSLQCAINGTRLRIGDLEEKDIDKLVAAHRQLAPYPIWFDDSTGASFEKLESACRKLKRQGQLDLIVVDYIQQFTLQGNARTAHEKMTAVSHRLKQLALELKVAVVALAQLNREAEKSEAQPDVWHIKDSGAIEQDADLVLLIHNLDRGTALFVGKNRNGKDRFTFPVDANLAFNAFKNVNLNLEAYK